MNIKEIIESLLLVENKPVSPSELADILKTDETNALEALNGLIEDYKNRGINIIQHDSKYEMITSPSNAKFVSLFLNEETRKDLNQGALETLAIVIYKQPVTKSEIENIRGVNCDYAVRSLLIRGIIEEKGRKESLGKPILYGTNSNLLKHFGIKSLDELPKTEDKND